MKARQISQRVLRVMLVVLLMFGVTFSFSSSDVSAANRNFTINVDSSPSTSGDYYVVSMELGNLGGDFTGFARLTVDYNQNVVGFDVDISIPKGTTKTYTVNVPRAVINSQNTSMVSIYDKKGKKIYSEKFSSVFNSNRNTFNVGILSDDPDSLSHMDNGGLKVNYANEKYLISLTNLDATNLVSSLPGLKCLIINDYDTTTLSDETIEAIKNWVYSGGALVVGTGGTKDKAIKGFGSFINVDVSTTFEENLDFQNDKMITVANLTINDASEQYVQTYDFYMTKITGSGVIEISTIDLADIDMTDDVLKGNVEFLYMDVLGRVASSSYNLYNQTISSYTLDYIQNYMEKPVSTGAGFSVLLLIIYVVLVGPICYLVLKAAKKQEKIWIAIPILSLIFVLFIFLLSLGVRVRGVSLKTVSAINVATDKKSLYVLGYAPEPKPWTVKTNAPSEYGDIASGSYYGSGEGSVAASIKQTGDGDEVTFYPSSAFDTKCAFLFSTVDYKADFNWNLNLPKDNYSNMDPQVDDYVYDSSDYINTGSVTNETGIDFDYVLMFSPGGCQLIEDFKNGDSEVIDLDDTGSSSYSSYNSSADDLLRKYAEGPYKKKDYKKSGAISAMVLTAEAEGGFNRDFVMIGVRESKSVTSENESAWECFYKFY